MPDFSVAINVLTAIPWRYVADTLIVSLLAIQLLRLVWRRRAGQILVGLVLLSVTAIAAQRLRLPLLDWILESLIPYLGFGVIVLFQGEIRRGLAQLGGWNPFRGISGLRRPNPYEDVVLAVGHFAQKKIGALIVLERQTGLRTHAESGVSLDARLSYDLLVTIFGPGAPLHDGAAIVQKDRLVAAACFLPLSVSPDRPRELGSRHRAALGITEETDAVAVVVAEQTGVISLAVEGVLESGVTPDRLRDRLASLFGSRARRGRPMAPFTAAERTGAAPSSAVVEMPVRRREP